jgi:hypothetical protein
MMVILSSATAPKSTIWVFLHTGNISINTIAMEAERLMKVMRKRCT